MTYPERESLRARLRRWWDEFPEREQKAMAADRERVRRNRAALRTFAARASLVRDQTGEAAAQTGGET